MIIFIFSKMKIKDFFNNEKLQFPRLIIEEDDTQKIQTISFIVVFGFACAFAGFWYGANCGSVSETQRVLTKAETTVSTIETNIGTRQNYYSKLAGLNATERERLTEERKLYLELGRNLEARQRINNNLERGIEDCEKIVQEIRK